MITKISYDIADAKLFLNHGYVIAIPTETVYGLAANCYDPKAVGRIYELKNRPASNPLILHICSTDMLSDIAAEMPCEAYHLSKVFWPGPLTLLLKKSSKIPDYLTGGRDTVAVRIPQHVMALELLNQLDYPLAAPSANPYNHISPTNAKRVCEYFENKIPLVLDGGSCKHGIESTIISFANNRPEILRYGSISKESIEKELGSHLIDNTNYKETIAPGMSLKHYAPITPLYITDDIHRFVTHFSDKRIGVLSFSKRIFNKRYPNEILSYQGNLEEAAKNLYEKLHILDHLGLDFIVTCFVPDEGVGTSINDRLRRASSKFISFNKHIHEHPFAFG
jgi:L-threonylcarbamoyladenylate synthase